MELPVFTGICDPRVLAVLSRSFDAPGLRRGRFGRRWRRWWRCLSRPRDGWWRRWLRIWHVASSVPVQIPHGEAARSAAGITGVACLANRVHATDGADQLDAVVVIHACEVIVTT